MIHGLISDNVTLFFEESVFQSVYVAMLLWYRRVATEQLGLVCDLKSWISVFANVNGSMRSDILRD